MEYAKGAALGTSKAFMKYPQVRVLESLDNFFEWGVGQCPA
jgi:hypothetical protein